MKRRAKTPKQSRRQGACVGARGMAPAMPLMSPCSNSLSSTFALTLRRRVGTHTGTRGDFQCCSAAGYHVNALKRRRRSSSAAHSAVRSSRGSGPSLFAMSWSNITRGEDKS